MGPVRIQEAASPFPGEWIPVLTGDGSFTLDNAQLQEHYHSVFGAATESRHVYITNGLHRSGGRNVKVLEVGLGTGLNALLTWMACRTGVLEVEYLGLEPFPVAPSLLAAVDHARAVGRPELREDFKAMMAAPEDRTWSHPDGFTFRWIRTPVQELDLEEAVDVVYFDAFAPSVQPAMWTVDVFNRIHKAMRPEAVLATYCAQGEARRAMEAAGMVTERIPGPPGKRQMLVAYRR